MGLLSYVHHVDGEGSIIVPKSVRPIIEYEETFLGNRKGAKRQFRYNKLHIREYDDYYTIHMDKIDPRKDPLGHILIDATEFLPSIIAAAFAAKRSGYAIYNKEKAKGKGEKTALWNGILTGCIGGMAAAATTSYIVSKLSSK